MPICMENNVHALQEACRVVTFQLIKAKGNLRCLHMQALVPIRACLVNIQEHSHVDKGMCIEVALGYLHHHPASHINKQEYKLTRTPAHTWLLEQSIRPGQFLISKLWLGASAVAAECLADLPEPIMHLSSASLLPCGVCWCCNSGPDHIMRCNAE